MNETVELFALAIGGYAVGAAGSVVAFPAVEACLAVDGDIVGETGVQLLFSCGVVVSEVKSESSIAAV